MFLNLNYGIEGYSRIQRRGRRIYSDRGLTADSLYLGETRFRFFFFCGRLFGSEITCGLGTSVQPPRLVFYLAARAPLCLYTNMTLKIWQNNATGHNGYGHKITKAQYGMGCTTL